MPTRHACLALVLSSAMLPLSCAPSRGAPPVYGQPAPAGPYAPTGAPLSGPRAPGLAGSAPAAPLAGGGSPGCGTPSPWKPGATTQRVSALGRERVYTVVVPDTYAPETRYPLVFALHGGGGNAAGARTQTDLEKVAAGRAVFVYPDAIGGSWNLDAETTHNGDVALFDAALLAVHNNLCLDSRRVFVTGFSNGAYMANQLACKRGDRIRGVVTHAGGGPYETAGSYDATGHLMCPGKAVASLVVHGDRDGTVALSEGQKSLDHWSYANRCSTGTAGAWLAPCVALEGCFQAVGLCRIPGLGHGLWSNAGKVTWAFFDALR
jgi:polyhydroxybutyrate depolymerase